MTTQTPIDKLEPDSPGTAQWSALLTKVSKTMADPETPQDIKEYLHVFDRQKLFRGGSDGGYEDSDDEKLAYQNLKMRWPTGAPAMAAFTQDEKDDMVGYDTRVKYDITDTIYSFRAMKERLEKTEGPIDIEEIDAIWRKLAVQLGDEWCGAIREMYKRKSMDGK